MNTQLARALYFAIQRFRREPITQALADVRQTEFFSLDALKQLQAQRQLDQLRFAVAHVPFYRDAYQPFWGQIESARTWDDVHTLMTQLPVIASDYVRRHKLLFTADNLSSLATHPDKTSGSSGAPLTFPCDQQSWAYRHAHIFRNMESFGVQIGEPYLYVFGLHWNRQAVLKTRLRDSILNRRRISAYEITPEKLDDHLRIIRSSKATHLIGYPSAVYELCLLLKQHGADDLRKLRLKAIFLTAEPLLSYQREVIQEITGARCVNQYGSAEGGLSAVECPHGELHITAETTWLQVSSEGSVLVTDMMMRAFPLIRYDLGDEAVLSDKTCTCGRAHPILAEVVGRSGDPITLPNGRVINANLPSYIFKPLSASGLIRRYRFIDQAGQELQLLLVVNDGFSDEHLQIVRRETRAAFGEDVPFSVTIVDEIPHLPNAKHRSYVRIADTERPS